MDYAATIKQSDKKQEKLLHYPKRSPHSERLDNTQPWQILGLRRRASGTEKETEGGVLRQLHRDG